MIVRRYSGEKTNEQVSSSFAPKRKVLIGILVMLGIILASTVALAAQIVADLTGNSRQSDNTANSSPRESAALTGQSSTTNLIGELNINIPTFFNDKLTVNNNFEVNGASLFTEDIKVDNKNVDLGTGRLTASNVLYSMTAGANITITGDPQNPTISAAGATNGVQSLQGETGTLTLVEGSGIGLNGLEITNTGVLSLGGETGDVELTAGDGISVDGTEITNDDPGSAQNIFKNIIVDATAFAASSNDDTLTFEAGTGITLTPDAATKTITINSTSGSGGVTDITGTANQVNTSASTGSVTLSLPQDIHTGATPTFASMILSANTNQITLGSGNTGVITLDTLNGNRTYTLPNLSGEICLDSGNCSGLGGALTGSGTTNFIAKFTSSSGLSDSSIFDNGKVGIGTTSPQGLLHVDGAPAGQALTVFNYTGSGQNILVGSASGITRFAFDASGNLNLTGGSYQIGGTNVLSSTALGTGVTSSSLTSVGTLTGGSISSGFGTISTGNTIQGTDITATGTTGFTGSGSGAGLTFSGTGNHVINASSGVLQLGATTLTGAITGNSQNITGLNNLSAGGTITFGGFTSDGGILFTNGSGQVSQVAAGTATQVLHGGTNPTFGAVVLGTDTTGNYVSNVSGGSGIGISGTPGAGWTPTVALGALTGDWNQTGAFDITLNNASSELRMLESAGGAFYGILDIGDLSGDRTFTFPDTTGTVCLVEAGNCAGSGTGVTTAGGTTNRLVRFTGGQAVGNASINDLYASGVAATIDASGNLGLGTVSPTALLHVNGGNTGGNAAAIINQTGSSGNDIFAASSSGTTRFVIANNGNIQFSGNTSFMNTVTSLATANRTYTLPDASGTICLTTGNCAGLGGGITGTGTAGQIAFFNGTGTITSETSGFAWDGTNKKLGIGNDTPAGKLDVNGAVTGKALVIVNETGNQDILTGSASGTTRFAFDRTGNLNIVGGAYQIGGTNVLSSTALGTGVTGSSLTSVGALNSGSIASGFGTISTANTIQGTDITATGTTGFTGSGAGAGLTFSGSGVHDIAASLGTLRLGAATLNGAITGNNNNITGLNNLSAAGTVTFSSFTGNNAVFYGTAGSGQLATATTNTSGQCLLSGGSNPVWSTCPGGTSYWTLENGALSPFSGTLDLLVGGNATTSAKFGFINANTGTPTASVSANSGSNATYLAGNGSLGTTNKQSLILGSSTTGDITMAPHGVNLLRLSTQQTSGNVGIGTSPFQTWVELSIQGQTGENSEILLRDGNNSNIWGLFADIDGSFGAYDVTNGRTPFAIDSNTPNDTLILKANGAVGIGNANPAGILDVRGSIAGKALSIFNETGGNDILTASASGITRLTLSNNGNLNLIGGAYQSNGVSGITQGSASCVTTTNGIVTGFGACQLGSEQWIVNNGAIYPGNPSLDLLLGGTSTAGAKFAFTNMIGAGTPTASISAQSGTNSALVLGADGTIQSVKNQTLTLGGNTTGNISLQPRNGTGRVGINTSSPGRDLEIASSTVNSTYMKFNPITSEDWSVGADDSGFIVFNDTDGVYRLIVDETGNVGIGSNDPYHGGFGRALEIAGDGGGAALTLTANNGKRFIIGSADTPAGLYFRDQTADVYRMMIDTHGRVGINTQTLDPLAMLDVRGNASHIPAASLSASTSVAALIADNRGTGDILTASSSGLTRFVIAQNGDTYTANGGRLGVGVAPTEQIHVAANYPTSRMLLKLENTSVGAGKSNAIEFRSGAGSIAWALGTDFGINGNNNFFLQDNNGTVRQFIDGNGLMAIGAGNTTPNATLDIRANSGTLPIASISGSSTFAAAIVDQNGTGDIFTASKSGATKFTILNSGNIQLNNYTTAGGLLYTTSTGTVAQIGAGNLGQCLISNGAGNAPSYSSCAGGTNFWQSVNAGTIAPFNTTYDLLVGGTATTSAKFAFINNTGSGTPTASISAQSGTNSALVLSADGSISTVKRQDLTLGGGATGNIFLSPVTGVNIGVNGGSGALNVNSFGGTLPINSYYDNNTYGIRGSFVHGGNAAGINNEGGLQIATQGTNNSTAGSGAIKFFTPTGDSGGNRVDASLAVRMTIAQSGSVGIGTTSPLATLDLRGISGTQPLASISGQTAFAGLVVDNSGRGDLFAASSSGRNRFVITQAGNVGIGTAMPTNTLDVDIQGLLDAGITIKGAPSVLGDMGLKINNTATGGQQWYFNSTSNGSVVGGGKLAIVPSSTGNAIATFTSTALGLGSNNFIPLATLDVKGTSGTTPFASMSGSTSHAGLVVDNRGNGDIFTASSSGLTRFTVRQDGVTVAGRGTINNVLAAGTAKFIVTDPTDARMAAVVNNSGIFYRTDGVTAGFYGYDYANSAAINLAINEFGGRVIVGSNANTAPLSSFDIRGTNGTIAVASASGNTSFAALVADNRGSGDIFTASSSGTTRFVIKQNGNVGIGTTNPIVPLQIESNAPDIAYGNLLYLNGSLTSTTNAQNGLRANPFIAPGSASTMVYTAAVLSASATNNNLAGATLVGSDSNVYYDGSGTIGTGTAGYFKNTLQNNGTMVQSYGVLVDGATKGPGCTTCSFTNAANVAIANQTNATNNTNLLLGTTTIPTGNYSLYNASTYNNYFAGRIGIGTTSPLAALDIRGSNATTPIASMAGSSTFAGMVIDNNGTGDIFTASKSGATKFTILNNGNLQLNNYTTGGGLLYTNGTGTVAQIGAGNLGQCLLSNGSGNAPSYGSCAGGTNFWQSASNGVISPYNNTVDLLVGGVSTNSATFHVYGASGSQATNPVASISGNTNKAALVIDNRGTGDLFTASSAGRTRFTIKQDGSIIGNTTSLTAFQYNTAAGNPVFNVNTQDPKFEIYGNAFDSDAVTAGTLSVNGPFMTIGDPLASQTFANGIGIKFQDNSVSHGTLKYNSSATTPRFDFCASNNTSALTCDVGTETLSIMTGAGSSVGINTTSPLAALDVRGETATRPIASISGSTTFAGLVVDNSGSGDIFTASRSGAMRFVIDSVGNIGIGKRPSLNLTTGATIMATGSAQFTSLSGAGLSDCDSSNSKLLWSDTTKQFSCGTDRSSVSIRKTTNEAVDNGTTGATLQNDNELTFAIGANDTYIVQMVVNPTFGAGGFQYTITAPAGATCVINAHGLDTTGGGPEITDGSCGTVGTFGGADSEYMLYIYATIVTSGTSGNVNFQWAQSSANAADTIVQDGSSMVAFKVNGADIAEAYYTRDSSIQPGDVVMVDGSMYAGVKKTEKAYDTKALGIISTKPGIVLGDDGTGHQGSPVLLALGGRVPVKVTTENGPIEPGDYLTTSSTPGVAMKATKAGQTIGKALGGFTCSEGGTSCQGTVMTFVNLSWQDPNVETVIIDGETDGIVYDSPAMDPETFNDNVATSSSFVDFKQDVSSKLSSLNERLSMIELEASGSALLGGNPGSFTASSAADLGLDNVTVTNKLNVAGRTTLADVGITGVANIGLLSIKGFDDTDPDNAFASINTTVGPLKLQSNGMNNIDMQDGKVLIDTKGNIQTEGEVTAKKFNVDTTDVAGASLGEITIQAGKTKATVTTEALTSESKIFVQAQDVPVITAVKKTAANKFEIIISPYQSEDIKLHWWIVN